MASGFSAAGAGAYEIGVSGSDARPDGAGEAGAGAAREIGTSGGSGACAATSIGTRRGVGSAACMPCGPTPGDMASAVATRQTATTRVRILFPMASLSVATGPIRSS